MTFDIDKYFAQLTGKEVSLSIPTLEIHDKNLIFLSSLGMLIDANDYTHMVDLLPLIEKSFYTALSYGQPNYSKVHNADYDYYLLVNILRDNAPDLIRLKEKSLGEYVKISVNFPQDS